MLFEFLATVLMGQWLTVPGPSGPQIVIHTASDPATWTYWMPFFASLTTVVAAVIAYYAVRVQAERGLAGIRLQLEADANERKIDREIEESRIKGDRERRYRAIRSRVINLLGSTAASFVAEGQYPGKSDLRNQDLLQTFAQLSAQAYELEVAENLSDEEREGVMNAVRVSEAALTFLKYLWTDPAPDDDDRKRVRKKCIMAISSIADALDCLRDFKDIYFREKIVELEKRNEPTQIET